MIKAAVTSDFHLDTSPSRSSAVIPALKYQPEIMTAFFAHIEDIKPDLLLILGDNTNGGRDRDVRKLKEYLVPLRNAGIEIIMIPGNHDFDSGSEELYEKTFFPLMQIKDRDPDSLSFSALKDDVLFLAMDDHEPGRSPLGVLKTSTLRWLVRQLEEARSRHFRTVFLSHHSLISEGWQPRKEFYCLQPEETVSILKGYDVRLALCGHQHDASINRDGCLYEAAVPMPADGCHQFGLLTISDHSADYRLERIPFPMPLAEKIREADALASETKKAVFRKLLPDTQEKDEMLSALYAFNEAHTLSLLYDRRESIKSMPGYTAAMDGLKDHIYRRWIECLLAEERLPENRLRIPF